MQLDDGRRNDPEIGSRPTVASVAAVASTSDDVEAAEPTHPDRPVGVDIDTAAIGTEPGATEGVDESESGAEIGPDREENNQGETMADLSPIDVQKALKGAEYPADKATLVQLAESSDAGDNVLEAIRSLPDETYDGPTDVTEALFN